MRWPILAAAAVIVAAALQMAREGGPAPRGRIQAPVSRGEVASTLPSPASTCAPPTRPAAARVTTPLDDLRTALAAQDPDAMARSADALAAWVGGDEGRARILVDGLRSEADPVGVELLALTLAGDALAATWGGVAREMLAAARGDPLADRRRAALLYLERSGARSAEIEADASWIARSDADALVRATAFELLGAIASSDAAAAARLHPILMAEAARGTDPSLRIAALQALDPRSASEEVLRGIGSVAALDAEPWVRLEAVARLRDASPDARPLVLDLLRAAGARGADEEVRRACEEAVAGLVRGSLDVDPH